MTTHQAAKAVLRGMERLDRLDAQRRALELAIAANGRTLCKRKGIIVPLKGPQLRMLAAGEVYPVRREAA